MKIIILLTALGLISCNHNFEQKLIAIQKCYLACDKVNRDFRVYFAYNGYECSCIEGTTRKPK